MKNQPKILLYADTGADRVGQSLSYVDFFSHFGEVILVTTANDLEYWLEHGDILAVPGGADVDPERYHEKPASSTSRANLHYEFLDRHLMEPWMKKTNKPIIGICRGLQTMNVSAGGSLFQHVKDHNLISKKQDRSDPTQELNTDIIVKIDDDVTDYRIHDVNSFHHQAIKKLAPGFEVLGWTGVAKGCPTTWGREQSGHKYFYEYQKGAGFKVMKDHRNHVREFHYIPEIIRHVDKPWLAFQYHPEDLNDELATALIWDMLKKYDVAIPPFELSIKLVKPNIE